MTASTNATPKGWKFFTGLCLVLGAVGFAVNALFLFLGVTHELSREAMEKSPIVLLSLLHMVRDGGFIVGGIMVKKQVGWARHLLVFCAAASLLELFYNTATSLAKGGLTTSPSTVAFMLIPLLLEGSILFYFSQRAVRELMQGACTVNSAT